MLKVAILGVLSLGFLVVVVFRFKKRKPDPDIVQVAHRLLKVRTRLRRYMSGEHIEPGDIFADIEATLLGAFRYLGAVGGGLADCINDPGVAKVFPPRLLEDLRKATDILYDHKVKGHVLSSKDIQLLYNVLTHIYNLFVSSKMYSNRVNDR